MLFVRLCNWSQWFVCLCNWSQCCLSVSVTGHSAVVCLIQPLWQVQVTAGCCLSLGLFVFSMVCECVAQALKNTSHGCTVTVLCLYRLFSVVHKSSFTHKCLIRSCVNKCSLCLSSDLALCVSVTLCMWIDLIFCVAIRCQCYIIHVD